MRLSVECGGFTRAADACRTANQIAALLTESLSARLADCAGMAGDDATSSELRPGVRRRRARGHARSRGPHALLHRHRSPPRGDRLEPRHRRGGGCRAGRLGIRRGQPRRRRVRAGPSGSTTVEPRDAAAVAQPGGRVDPRPDRGLRLAGRRCREGAQRCHGVASSSSIRGRPAPTTSTRPTTSWRISDPPRSRSPCLPWLSSRHSSATPPGSSTRLPRACEEYAAAVEEAHARTRALLVEIGQMVVEGVALSAVVTGVTGGLGGGAAAAVALARVRAYAPRFHALLVALRAGTATATARLRTARDELVAVQTRAEKFLRVPARTERGEMRHPLAGWHPEAGLAGGAREAAGSHVE